MNITHLKTILPHQDGAAKITALAWSPNNLKLAVATAERVIVIFDDQGEKRDKFSTKPADAKYGKKSYIIKGIAFSPDSTKLAVGQSDNIIYVYKIGEDWGEKKVICNKFVQSSNVTSIIWPYEGPIIFGLLDGKVRAANIKNNKSQTLYPTDSHVVALVANQKGSGFLSGHADGSIVRFYVAEESAAEQQGRIISHPVPPYALCWTNNGIIVGGCDKRIVVYSSMGKMEQTFDFSRDGSEREFTTIASSPSGQAIVVGSYDRLRIFDYKSSRSFWEEVSPKNFEGIYSITAMGWKKDGSKLAFGTLCGGAELFDTVLRRSIWKNKWEMTYVGPSQVLVKPLAGSGPHGSRGVILRSNFGLEIQDVKIMGKDRFLVARTSETLMLGDLHRNLLSEVHWPSVTFEEKFYFDNENVCMIFRAGELSLVEYGSNEILGSVRTEFMNPHLISVRLNERPRPGMGDNKKLAYLLDVKTISLLDLVFGISLGQVNHDSKIDWLEMNETGQSLLFRDKKLRLVLVDISTMHKTTLLNYSTFVQWVPGSDVVVAQSRDQLCVWYNIDNPERITSFTIKGDVVDIERTDGRTEVIVEDGHQELSYALDEGLVEFRTAVDDGDYLRAMNYLETLPYTTESEAMWRSLGKLALEANHLFIAERCYAALGDASKVKYLQEINNLREESIQKTGEDGIRNYEVQAKLAILNKQFKTAESIYLENNDLEAAMKMYQDLLKWDEALQLAEVKGHTDIDSLRNSHMQWLLQTQQEGHAGKLKEQLGDYNAAIELYLKARMPAKAASLVSRRVELQNDYELVSRIAEALMKTELFERAGELYEKVGSTEDALDCYRRGNAFSKAIDLARHSFPSEVVRLEEEWGDELMASKQSDAAISHYIEAGHNLKALDAAISARQWKKATHISEVIDDDEALQPYLLKLGQHFGSLRDYKMAEKFFVQGQMYQEAIQMYNQAGEWDRAHQLASNYMRADEVAVMYVKQAQELEDQGKFKQAEKLYISVNEPDLAITMHQKQRQFKQMMDLVERYHPEHVQSTYAHLAREMEREGNYKESEKYFLAAADWKSAVNMYRTVDLWEDAYRVAKKEGGAGPAKQIAFLWARNLRGDAAVKLLNKYALLEPCIDYCCESLQFDFAFELARIAMKQKQPEIHYKYAMALEDEGKFKEAEEQFVKAGKPREAVLMYVHVQDWDSAQRVAETCDDDSVTEVLIGQAKVAFQNQDYQKAEALLLRAERPELVVKLYKDTGRWGEALRVCKEYLPHKLEALQDEYDNVAISQGSQDVQRLMQQAKHWEESREYTRAVDCYMKLDNSVTSDHEVLEKAWIKASELASKHLAEDKASSIAAELGPRLLRIKRYTSAAQIFIAGDLIKEAIEAFIEAKDWAKAKKVAQELEPRYEEYVDKMYKNFLKEEGKAEALVDVDLSSALDMYIEKGQWSQALEVAASHGPQLLHKYLAQYATMLIKNERPLDALALFKQHGAPAYKQNFNIYIRLVQDMWSQQSGLAYSNWADMRDVLFNLFNNLHQQSNQQQDQKAFEELLVLCHYFATREAFRHIPQLEDMATKISVSLLRHTDVIPADKAFFEAGMDCMKKGWDNMAFVFLNRFLDLCEAIEEGTVDSLDHSDFLNTDIPFEITLPESISVPSELREEAKEWVLTVSMDQKIDQKLNVDERNVYEASLIGPNGNEFSPCLITGYPVIRNPMHLKHGQVMHKDDWNKLVMAIKVSNSVEAQDVVKFISSYGGGIPNAGYGFQ